MMYSPDKMMGSKGLHGAPITAPGCFPSGRYSPPPYRAAPDPMPPPPRRCMPNSTVSEITCSLFDFCQISHRSISHPRVFTISDAENSTWTRCNDEWISIHNTDGTFLFLCIVTRVIYFVFVLLYVLLL